MNSEKLNDLAPKLPELRWEALSPSEHSLNGTVRPTGTEFLVLAGWHGRRLAGIVAAVPIYERNGVFPHATDEHAWEAQYLGQQIGRWETAEYAKQVVTTAFRSALENKLIEQPE